MTLAVHNRRALYERVVEEVQKRNMFPEDRFEIAALLESMGWNDSRASEQLGMQDVFELADTIWEHIQQRVVVTPFEPPPKRNMVYVTFELTKSFLRGVIFALPMAISVVSMLTLKFSLWSYEYLTVELATCIAIGTILSFIVVGGYTQAIARRGFFYLFQGYYNMGRRVTFQFIRAGYVTCLVTCVLIYGFNVVFNVFPMNMFMYIVLYFFFLTSIWLSVTVMYILRRELTFTGLIIMGIFIVFLLMTFTPLDIIFAQLISISIVSATGMLLVLYFFKVAERKEEKGITPQLPRMSITVYSVMPYFIYGFLYFFFLFIDRINAWSAHDSYMPYFIWFRGEYELGLDFALLVLMVPLGVSEVIVHKLMLDLEDSQKQYWGAETDRMNRFFKKVYFKMFGVIVVTSVASAALVWKGMHLANDWYVGYAGKPLISSDTTEFVFVVALIAYVILAIALMNAVILFSLSQADMVNRSIIPAVGVNALVGFLLSRWFEYDTAIFGLLAGSIVFAVLSVRHMLKVLNKLDYYLYAAG
ncbi:hypothetical protein [Paenibacillus sp.]|uniref:hypothetical protein n=1 Tax=Paenibacillus sp. TaxID=58172 RepID=UPI002D35A965|nr:hypothetical protein [Paenibacillus sp.]HZG88376.1 hypothetical protein [Paenibacillus sp.]